MAATPKGATFYFKGLKTGQTQIKDVYNPDTAGALFRWDSGAGASATSSDFVTFDEQVVCYDISAITGIVDTTKGRIVANGIPTTSVFQWATHLNTLNQRPALAVVINAGTRFQVICVA